MRECSYCGEEYSPVPGANWSVFCLDCPPADAPRELPQDRYIVALERLRALISGGLALKYYDCVAIGQKDTACSWGLCNNSKEMWPDKMDHIWPHEFETRGRIAPLHRVEGQPCPLDRAFDGRNLSGSKPSHGCFYRCMVFQGGPIAKDDMLARLDALLRILERE